MDGVVVDCSVILAVCFHDERNDYAVGVMRGLSDTVPYAPAVWPLELGNTLLVAERRNRITAAEGDRVLADVVEVQVQVQQEPPARMLKEVFALAREHQLSTYDASYLDLAMRMDLPLATLDKALRRAAGKCGVDLFKP